VPHLALTLIHDVNMEGIALRTHVIGPLVMQVPSAAVGPCRERHPLGCMA
jgi:hypothetical protein